MPVLSPGTTLKRGTFEIVSYLGRGGFGEVYLARQTRIERDVAIKVLLPHVSENADVVMRFQREALAAASLVHLNVLTVHDFDFDDAAGVWFLAMQYVPGGKTLRGLLGSPLSLDDVLPIVEGIAGALDAAHARGIVHRDVKPENVLLDGRRPLLADFGIAHLTQLSGMTATGLAVGTPAYMSPEQATDKPVSPRSDQYALAIIVYEMLAGRPPFVGNPASLILQHASVAPPPLSSFNPRLGAAARAVILLALSKNPDDRFDSCLEFVRGLKAAAGEATLAAPARAPDGSVSEAGPVEPETRSATPDLPSTRAMLQPTLPGAAPTLPSRTTLFSVEIRGEPSGAVVAIDDEEVGVIPCTVDGLPRGPHRLVATAPGYVAAEQSLSVPADGPIVLRLEEQTHTLSVAGLPLGAAVWLDGYPAGSLPVEIAGLRAGEHVVTVEHLGWVATSQTVELPRTGQLEVKLAPEVSSVPQEAPLVVDLEAAAPISEVEGDREDTGPVPTGEQGPSRPRRRRLVAVSALALGIAAAGLIAVLAVRMPLTAIMSDALGLRAEQTAVPLGGASACVEPLLGQAQVRTEMVFDAWPQAMALAASLSECPGVLVGGELLAIDTLGRAQVAAKEEEWASVLGLLREVDATGTGTLQPAIDQSVFRGLVAAGRTALETGALADARGLCGEALQRRPEDEEAARCVADSQPLPLTPSPTARPIVPTARPTVRPAAPAPVQPQPAPAEAPTARPTPLPTRVPPTPRPTVYRPPTSVRPTATLRPLPVQITEPRP